VSFIFWEGGAVARNYYAAAARIRGEIIRTRRATDHSAFLLLFAAVTLFEQNLSLLPYQSGLDLICGIPDGDIFVSRQGLPYANCIAIQIFVPFLLLGQYFIEIFVTGVKYPRGIKYRYGRN